MDKWDDDGSEVFAGLQSRVPWEKRDAEYSLTQTTSRVLFPILHLPIRLEHMHRLPRLVSPAPTRLAPTLAILKPHLALRIPAALGSFTARHYASGGSIENAAIQNVERKRAEAKLGGGLQRIEAQHNKV
ncbi:hypothetical protein BC937DRAFT_91816 [Endogone sp. FLAS-F59071]|nr:hypothetical protein BC937DRAFT_91816 [Endogone sp. FLAS-F59071]|eukprot:RUS15914.1 hypothetical protein BC937DRAFT_91816 [Endogone sp. FLAS-F59071]